MAKSVDPDQMPNSAASDLGLCCLQWPICPNTLGYYSMFMFYFSSQKLVNYTIFVRNLNKGYS